jgi:hypothetical protein
MMGRLAALMLAGACVAAPATSFAAGNQISGVVVAAEPEPAVASSYPASGASIPAGMLILKVVFDQPMKPDAWAYGPSAGVDFPKCLAQPRLLSDQKTFVLLCMVTAKHTFALEINPAPRFSSDHERAAKPYTLQFSTTDTVEEDLHDALQQAGLRDVDEPIMDWRPAAQGVSQTPAPSP